MNVRVSVKRVTLERVEIKLILLTEANKRRARTNRVRREREYPLGPQSRHFTETKESWKGPKEAYPDTSRDSDPKRPSRNVVLEPSRIR